VQASQEPASSSHVALIGRIELYSGQGTYGQEGTTAIVGDQPRIVHIPYVLEQDEDGVWCASAQLRAGVGAVGDGATPEAAIADLREALEALLAETGPPDELTLTLNVA